MPTFLLPEAFQEHKLYVALLKKALLTVKPEAEKKFAYFKQYPFGPKKLPLVLVDFDLKCTAALAKNGVRATCEGVVSLTPEGELNFEAKKGTLKRIGLKKYFATMGGGIKPVFVPPGETEDEEGETETSEAAVLPPGSEEPKRQQILARIQELQGQSFTPAGEALKKQALEKARALAEGNRLAEATLLLDKLAGQIAGTSKPAGSKVQFEKVHLEWDAQKKLIEGRLAELNKAILEEFNDPEGTTAANNLRKVLARFNEGLGDTLDEMRNAATPDARAPIAAKAGAIADRYLKYLQEDPLVEHVENNPFEVKVDVRGALSAPLSRLKQQLQQLNG